MHSRRIACFLLGLWLAGGIFMAWVASQNLRAVDRLMDRPNPVALLQFKALGPASARLLLLYQAAEQTRFFYESWEAAQIVLGAFFLLFLLFGTREDKYSLLMAAAMLAIVAVERCWMTPQAISLGRVTDFIPEAVNSVDRVKLVVLRTGYSGAELAKAAVGLGLALRLVLGSRRASGRNVRQEIDLIDKANYRHING